MSAPDITLSNAEIQAITGYKRANEQLRELHRQGFWRARRSILGSVVLERPHYDAVCAGGEKKPTNAGRPRPQLRPA